MSGVENQKLREHTHSINCFNIIELLVYTKNLTNAHRTPLEHTRTSLELR